MLTIKDNSENTYYTDAREQKDSIGNKFNLSGIKRDLTKPVQFRVKNGNNVACYCWIYEYRYLHDRSKGFDIYINQNDVFTNKIQVC